MQKRVNWNPAVSDKRLNDQIEEKLKKIDAKETSKTSYTPQEYLKHIDNVLED